MFKEPKRRQKPEIREIKTRRNKQKITMVDLNLSIPIITLNLNGLKTPIKKHRLSDWMKK